MLFALPFNYTKRKTDLNQLQTHFKPQTHTLLFSLEIFTRFGLLNVYLTVSVKEFDGYVKSTAFML